MYLLRAFQTGMSMADLDELTVGMVFDIMIEQGNDQAEYEQVGSLDDFK